MDLKLLKTKRKKVLVAIKLKRGHTALMAWPSVEKLLVVASLI